MDTNKYNMMIKNRDGSLFSIIEKTLDESVELLNQHINDEYNMDKYINNSILYNIVTGKTKKSFLNQLILKIEQIKNIQE